MQSRCFKPLHIHKKSSLIKSLFCCKSRMETITQRLWGFVSSGDFSGTINIWSQTRQHLFNYLFLTGTHFAVKNSSVQIFPLIRNIWKPLKKQRAVKKNLCPLSELKIWGSASALPWAVNHSQFVIGSCSSSSPSPCFPTGSVVLWTLSVTRQSSRRPPSLHPHTLRTLISHNIPWVPSANRKWHSSHR